jgi:hypothetical protein
MEVSNFEILYKPITPSLGAGTEAIARRVLQGYFLSVANTSTFDFIFKIAFNITLPSPDNPSRRLDANALFITDVASPDNVFATTLTRSPPGEIGIRARLPYRLEKPRLWCCCRTSRCRTSSSRRRATSRSAVGLR